MRSRSLALVLAALSVVSASLALHRAGLRSEQPWLSGLPLVLGVCLAALAMLLCAPMALATRHRFVGLSIAWVAVLLVSLGGFVLGDRRSQVPILAAQRDSERIVSRVRGFARSSGRLPSSLTELGLPTAPRVGPERYPVFYAPLNDTEFELGFQASWYSHVYSSDTCSWRSQD